MYLTVAIIGRPNVGKSTLLNRLAGFKAALVHDTPGVTRDRKEVFADFKGLPLKLIDTAGFETGDKGSIEARMQAQTKRAVDEADVCFTIPTRTSLFLYTSRQTPKISAVYGKNMPSISTYRPSIFRIKAWFLKPCVI